MNGSNFAKSLGNVSNDADLILLLFQSLFNFNSEKVVSMSPQYVQSAIDSVSLLETIAGHRPYNSTAATARKTSNVFVRILELAPDSFLEQPLAFLNTASMQSGD